MGKNATNGYKSTNKTTTSQHSRLHLWSPVGICSSCVCLHLHLALQVLGSKSRRRWNQNSPTSSGRVGTQLNALQEHDLHGTLTLRAGMGKWVNGESIIRFLLVENCKTINFRLSLIFTKVTNINIIKLNGSMTNKYLESPIFTTAILYIENYVSLLKKI